MNYLEDEKVQQASKYHCDARDRMAELEKEHTELLVKKVDNMTGRDQIRKKEIVDLLQIAQDDLAEAQAAHNATLNESKNNVIQKMQPGYIKQCQVFHAELDKALKHFDKCESMYEELAEAIGGFYSPLHWTQFKNKLEWFLQANPGALK